MTVHTVGWLAVVVPVRMPRAALAGTVTVCATLTVRVSASSEPVTPPTTGVGGVPSTTSGEKRDVLVPVAVVAATVTVYTPSGMAAMVRVAVYGSVVVPSPSLGVKGRFRMKAKLRAEFHSEKVQAVTAPPAGGWVTWRRRLDEYGWSFSHGVRRPTHSLQPGAHASANPPSTPHPPALGLSTDRLMVWVVTPLVATVESAPEMAAIAGRVGGTSARGECNGRLMIWHAAGVLQRKLRADGWQTPTTSGH